MRGEDRRSEGFFSYVRLEARIAADHPLRAIRDLVDEALGKLSAAFTRLYAREGTTVDPAIVGLSADDPVWDATVFCKNRDRLLDRDISRKFMTTLLNLPQVRTLLSSEHFSVDGTLIEAWASMKSFVPKDGSPPSSSSAGRGGGRNAARDNGTAERTTTLDST